MIIWQGKGVLGVVIPFIFLVVGQIGLDATMGEGYYSSHSWAPAACLALSAVVIWVLGRELNKRPVRELVDPKTQQKVILKEKHTMFWMPLQYFAWLVLVFASYMYFKDNLPKL